MKKEYTSIKVISYAMPYFLWSLLNNGVKESDFVITQEDDELVVRIRTDALMEASFPKAKFLKNENNEVPCSPEKKDYVIIRETPKDFRINDYDDSNTMISVTIDSDNPAPTVIM